MPGPKPKKIRFSLWLLGGSVLLFLTVLVLLQSSNLWKSFSVESAGDTLLLYGLSSLNFAAFVVFGFIFLRSIVRLMRERRALQLGSKLKTRLLFYFVMISILPITAMAGFSYLFMNRAIERWFVQIPENIVRLPEEVENKAVEAQHSELARTARMLAASLQGTDPGVAELSAIRNAGTVGAIAVIDDRGRTIALSGEEIGGSAEFLAARTAGDNSPALRDGVGIDAASAEISGGRRLVIAVDRGPASGVSETVQTSLEQFDRLKASNITVRQVGFLTLGVLTFMLIFASMWTAFYVARGFTTPIRALAEGAEKIAQGELGQKVDVVAEDELALLVSTFNEMSARLEANAAELQERRRYIETVLLTLPTGVISIDSSGRVSTINPAARNILHIRQGNVSKEKIADLLAAGDREIIERLISRAQRVGHASDQVRLQPAANGGREGGEMAVSITAAALPEAGGVVLVIEDLSELIAAQRASAWQEVARRMAHEIKNPLTPIQLSAERIAKRFSAANGGNSADVSIAPDVDQKTQSVVSEGTKTIIREVQSLKAMVDEFSRFARLPEVSLSPGDLNNVIREAAELYDQRSDEVAITLDLASELPAVMLDAEQLKRVFVNLIDNAIEAPGNEAKTVTIVARHDTARDIVVAEVADNGRGIDPADYQKLFQPYFSTKGRGTGLGLAIVQRIITEHQGKIKAVPNQPKGAKFIIELPVAS